MKYFYTTLSILLLFSIVGWSQDAAQLLQQADSLYDVKSYLASGELYDQAFAMQEGTSGNYYNAACAWALAENAEKAISYLNKAAEKGWHNRKWMEQDKDLRALHGTPGWNEVIAIVQKNLDVYEKDLDKPLKEQLEAIYVKDQTLRLLYQDAEEKFGRESDEMKYFWELVSEQDHQNEAEVIKILDERGWPGKTLVGGKANMAVWLVIQHAPLEIQEKYLPLLRESAKKGESQGSHLALLEDRILMRNGKKQIYGSQVITNPETGAYELHPIEDPANVNKRRAEVGLGPIEAYVRRWGIEFKVNK